MRAFVRIVAAGLALTVVTAACTAEPERERHRHEETTTCRLAVGRARSGDVPVALDGVAPDDVWAVGAHYEGGAGIPYARRWDGEAWQAERVQIVSEANAGFHDVVAVSGREAWAVGSMRGAEPMAERWDGSAWVDVPVAAVGAQEAELFGVTAAARRRWAVGRARFGLRWRTLVMAWDGASWAAVDAPSPGRVDAALRAADAATPDDVWAVGWTAGAGGRLRTLALHSDGRRWTRVRTPDPGPGDHLLSAVAAVSHDEAWAVGWSIGSDGRDRPLILRWNGGRWRPVPAPAFDGRAQLIDVAAPKSGDAWAAGRVTDDTQTFGSLVLHWDGDRWVQVETPDVGAEDDTLAGIAVVDGFPLTVGTSVDIDGRYTSLTLSGC
jgi:hypothetical protein